MDYSDPTNTGSGRRGPDPAFPLLFHENPASRTFLSLSRIPFFLSQKYIYKDLFLKKLINLRCRLALLIDILRSPGWFAFNIYLGRDDFPNSRQTGNKIPHPVSRAQILANPATLVAVKSRTSSRYCAFSRIPHRILVKSRIPRIPFQTLLTGPHVGGPLWGTNIAANKHTEWGRYWNQHSKHIGIRTFWSGIPVFRAADEFDQISNCFKKRSNVSTWNFPWRFISETA